MPQSDLWDSHCQQKPGRTKSPATLYGYGIRTPAVVEARNAYMRSYMRRNKARRARYMQTYRSKLRDRNV